MSRYDVESDTQFVQKTMDNARAYKDEQARKQNKFAKKLLAFDTIVSGANWAINEKANALEISQAPKKAAYQTMLNRNVDIRATEEQIRKSGLTRLEYLTEQNYQIYKDAAEKNYPDADLGTVGTLLYEEAMKTAKANLPTFNRYLDMAAQFPTFENFDEYYEKHSDQPRSIASWIGSSTKNALTKETTATINHKARKAEDALYGSSMFTKFEGLQKSIKDYDAASNNMPQVLALLKKEIAAGKLKGKMVIEPTFTTIDDGRDKITNLNIVTKDLESGELIPKVIEVDRLTNYASQEFLSIDEIKKMLDSVVQEHQETIHQKLYTESTRATKENVDAAFKYMTSNFQILAIDYSNENDKLEKFDTLYKIKLASAETFALDSAGNPTTRKAKIWTLDAKTKDIRLKTDPTSLKIAKHYGLTREAVYADLENAGGQLAQQNSTQQQIITPSSATFNWAQKGYMTAENLLTDATKLKNFQDTTQDKNGEFYAIYGKQITDNIGKGLDDFQLGRSIDLGQIFQGIFNQGELGDLYYDEGKIVIRLTNATGTPKYQAIP
jgi:hypothetical protein